MEKEVKHNLSEEYLRSLSEEERTRQNFLNRTRHYSLTEEAEK